MQRQAMNTFLNQEPASSTKALEDFRQMVGLYCVLTKSKRENEGDRLNSRSDATPKCTRVSSQSK